MSKGLNKVMLIGNLGREPEVRQTGGGKAVANLSLATNAYWGGENHTEWHRVVAFGKLADVCGQYLKKGSRVYVEGRIQTRQWEGKDGGKRYTTEIVMRELVMLGDERKGGYESQEPSYSQPNDDKSDTNDYETDTDDDLPF